ncbi:hypothetical protein Ahy_B03g067509 [Arachis hypogaea]|uniref:Protein FAR1-RELATED SEQUENCE n=1 Tax=Arachis hypogaea TaxID=3818 RepID=A0A445A700_ARAHY|nr:hypothetical protein Ahy_B03g067509 [Arachis hypogaea]
MVSSDMKIEQKTIHVIWNSFTKDAFDRNWNNFLMKYGVGGITLGSFSCVIFELCPHFAEPFEDHHLWISVRMRSTQRNEIMHTFFNKFITRNSSLIQFVKQYDNCLRSREQRERI